MKKGLLIVVALLVGMTAQAQFGIMGGLNVSNYAYRYNGQDLGRDPILGFNAGIFYRTQGGLLGVQPSLSYSGKGARNYDTPPLLNIDYYNNKLQYIQFSMPVTLQFPIPGSYWENSFDIGAGPYVSALVDASSIAHSKSGTETRQDYSIGNRRTDDYRPMDAGINLLMGVKLYRVGFYLGYDAGLTDIAPDANVKIYNQNFSARLHVFF